jgi:hypothetical protein
VGENDNSVDIETFRQKERIKLSEVERKKRESNNNNVPDNNKHTAGSNKRVNNNIKASPKAPEQSDNLAPLKNDRKRKPRYKKYLADDTTGKFDFKLHYFFNALNFPNSQKLILLSFKLMYPSTV